MPCVMKTKPGGLKRIGESDFDPKLALFSLGATTLQQDIQINCMARGSNDDDDTGELNSQIIHDFAAGEYLVWMGIYGGSGPGRLEIERADANTVPASDELVPSATVEGETGTIEPDPALEEPAPPQP